MKLVLSNIGPADALGLARALVDSGLAACVNLLPGVQSVYSWQGARCVDAETTLLIKVAAVNIASLTDKIRELHPYDTPEIIVLDVDLQHTDPRYLSWVRATADTQSG